MSREPKIVDCFTFFNELDILELRLKTHSPVVDRFLIVEARRTFQGREKPCYLEENAARFAQYADKITHIIIDEFTETTSSWHREAEQRNAMNAYVEQLEDDDIVLLSDVDELVRPESLEDLKVNPPSANEVVCFSLRYYFYFLNLIYVEPWQRLGPRAVRKGSFTGMQNLRGVRGPITGWGRNLVRGIRAAFRMKRPVTRRLVSDAGWHFAWLGGEGAAIAKVNAISTHSAMRKSEAELNKDILNARRSAMTEDKNFQRVEIDASYPAGIRDNLDRWRPFILS